jgi:hypothetical protein
MRESTAWCRCGDALETIPIYKIDKRYGKIIARYEYYCLGCDETFVLHKKVKKDE